VALVDFLPEIGGALAGIPTVIFAAFHSLTAGIVTLVVFLIYTQVENHVLNPVIMSKTVRVNPLLVLMAVLVGAELGNLVGGLFGAFVAALLAIPAAGALQVLVREFWRATDPKTLAPSAPAAPEPAPREAAPPEAAAPEAATGSADGLFPTVPEAREHGS
jgi:predicted PurR-regulated permease PerM